MTPDERIHLRYQWLILKGATMFAIGMLVMKALPVEASGVVWVTRHLAFLLTLGGMLVGGTGLAGLLAIMRR
jgi:hypothetical protein